MVQMPTGTGKTQVLASIVNELIAHNEQAITNIWIVAHRRELVEQIEETVARYGIRKESGLVKVMSIQWLSRHWEELEEKPDLIIIDEAHHVLAETYKELWIRCPKAKKLGMTATPCRLNRKGFTDLFETLVEAWSIAEFIRKGWLSVFDYISIRPDSEEQRLIESLAKRGADGDYQVKEMNEVLNRRPSIGRLYRSIQEYAKGKKGIVYAVCIDHARNIAAYYRERGIEAVAIDSKTPVVQRKILVEEFRQGKIQVLVNVDVFSEGFDCPDVEFVQLARPTLSLAKYLQQVGRGLRKSEGKASCVVIDNVGLYRMFGLPTVYRDWRAMFEGRLAGRGYALGILDTGVSVRASAKEAEDNDSELEVVMTHEALCLYLQNLNEQGETEPKLTKRLKAFRDKATGLWGLRQGEKVVVKARYLKIFDVSDRLAAVKFEDWSVGLVDDKGRTVWKGDSCNGMKLMKGDLLRVTDERGKDFFIDIRNKLRYEEKPKVLKFGRVEMIKAGDWYYSRTQKVYKTKRKLDPYNCHWMGFYLKMNDYGASFPVKMIAKGSLMNYHCILENDEKEVYAFCGAFPDSSIIVRSEDGKYYHVAEGKEKQYIACDVPASDEENFDIVVPRLMQEISRKELERQEADRQRKEEERRERLEKMKNAEPFKAGLKWGLKSGDTVVVPPIYRNIRHPVGNYCAFENYPHQWGIMALDGQIVVAPKYMDVEIGQDGMAYLTLIPGKIKTVKLE